MHIVNNYVRTRGLALVPQSVFEHSVDNNLFQLCKPPSKKHAGTRLRQVPLFPMLAARCFTAARQSLVACRDSVSERTSSAA